MGVRLEAAVAIRDAALEKIRAEGIFKEIKNFGPALVWPGKPSRDVPIQMILRTPFQNIPRSSPETRKKAFLCGLSPKELSLPYGLNIWASEGKVYNIEWEDQGKVEIVSFRRGNWEETVLSWQK